MGAHPNVVTVHDLASDADGTQYLVLAFVPGGTLAERIARGPLPVTDVLRITADVARALQAAHDRGLVHRDIKPANIFVTEEGRALVGDWGICQMDDISGRTNTATGHPGTPLYMSPEQERMATYLRPASDQYSLGLVLFEMLMGEIYKRVGERRSTALLAAQPAPIATLVGRMIAEHPDDRLASMRDVIWEIGRIERALAAMTTGEGDQRGFGAEAPVTRGAEAQPITPRTGHLRPAWFAPVAIGLVVAMAIASGMLIAARRPAPVTPTPTLAVIAVPTVSPMPTVSPTPVIAVAAATETLPVTPTPVPAPTATLVPVTATLSPVPQATTVEPTPLPTPSPTPAATDTPAPIAKPTAVAATAAETKLFVVNTDGTGVNLRDKPDDTTGKILTNVPEGTQVVATGAAVNSDHPASSSYYPVRVGDKTGYIRADFLGLSPSPTRVAATSRPSIFQTPITLTDPVAFCKRVDTADSPVENYVGTVRYGGPSSYIHQYDGGSQTTWRCFQGKVLGCIDGPQIGDCQKVNFSREPRPEQVTMCHDDPSYSQFPESVIDHASAYGWTCNNGLVRISSVYIAPADVDSRGYIARFWSASILP